MSRRGGKRKEDWGGEGSDENATGAPAAIGMDAVLRRGSTKSALSLNRGGGGGEDGSSGEEDSGADSEVETTGAAGEESKNTRERARPTDEAGRRRDHEVVHTARLHQQGIQLDEEDDDQARRGADWHAAKQTEAQKQQRKQKAMETAAAAAAAASADAEMADGEEEMEDPRALQARIKARFDKDKDDKYMTFDADDPLKPNPNKKRAAAREDEELEDDNTDPWLKQAAEDSARAAAAAENGDDSFSDLGRMGKKPMRASTDIFNHDEEAPIFDQAAARVVLLRHMRPGETVLRAVKRLGEKPAVAGGAVGGAAAGGKLGTKMKNVRTKKLDAPAVDGPAIVAVDPEVERLRKLAFAEVTEAAQGFIASNAPEIYQDSYEKLAHLVAAEQARKQAAAAHRAAPTTHTASVGMDARARAAARLQRKRDARAAGLPEPDSSDDDDDAAPRAAAPSSASASALSASPPAELQWVYRWSTSDAEIQGPFPSSKMIGWQAAGFLAADVIVRAATAEATAPWLRLSQIDFATGDVSAAAAKPTHAEPPKKKFKF